MVKNHQEKKQSTIILEEKKFVLEGEGVVE